MPYNDRRWKRVDRPNVARFLTFSCYNNKHFFKSPQICRIFLETLNNRRLEVSFEIWAYVLMPDHVHLLLFGGKEVSIRKELATIKRQSAFKILKFIKSVNPDKIDELIDNHGHKRIWKSGGGYDRDLWTPKEILKTIEYIHNNPIRAGLSQTQLDYYWSSADSWHNQSVKPIKINPDSFKI